jgi:hypothetical protein
MTKELKVSCCATIRVACGLVLIILLAVVAAIMATAKCSSHFPCKQHAGEE